MSSQLFSDKLGFRSDTCEWETPAATFDDLAQEFGPFDLDVCASRGNAKCPNFYTKEDNGLLLPWEGRCWMNPPYGRGMIHWMRKASESAREGALVVALLPARTDTRWFHDYIYEKPDVEVRFLKGRLKFGGAKSAAPFPSMVVIFGKPTKRERR